MADQYLEFYEAAGRHYPEDAITYSSLSGQVRRRWVLSCLRRFPDGDLLDCGCNIGRLSAGWRRGRVFGIDLSLDLLARGKMMFPRTHFIQGDLRRMGFLRAGSIDHALVVEVIEHLDRPMDFMKHLFDCLRPGGRVLITAPGYSRSRPAMVPLGIIRSFGIDSGTDGSTYLHTAYQAKELAAMARAAGFTVLEQGSFEHELRGWTKPFTLLLALADALGGRYFPRSRLLFLYHQCAARIELFLFMVLDMFGFSRLLRRLFPIGRRSFVLLTR